MLSLYEACAMTKCPLLGSVHLWGNSPQKILTSMSNELEIKFNRIILPLTVISMILISSKIFPKKFHLPIG